MEKKKKGKGKEKPSPPKEHEYEKVEKRRQPRCGAHCAWPSGLRYQIGSEPEENGGAERLPTNHIGRCLFPSPSPSPLSAAKCRYFGSWGTWVLIMFLY